MPKTSLSPWWLSHSTPYKMIQSSWWRVRVILMSSQIWTIAVAATASGLKCRLYSLFEIHLMLLLFRYSGPPYPKPARSVLSAPHFTGPLNSLSIQRLRSPPSHPNSLSPNSVPASINLTCSTASSLENGNFSNTSDYSSTLLIPLLSVWPPPRPWTPGLHHLSQWLLLLQSCWPPATKLDPPPPTTLSDSYMDYL